MAIWEEMNYNNFPSLSQHDRLVYEYDDDIYEQEQ